MALLDAAFWCSALSRIQENDDERIARGFADRRTRHFRMALSAAAPAARVRDLSFDERVAAQIEIEQVYWTHRIWPKAVRKASRME